MVGLRLGFCESKAYFPKQFFVNPGFMNLHENMIISLFSPNSKLYLACSLILDVATNHSCVWNTCDFVINKNQKYFHIKLQMLQISLIYLNVYFKIRLIVRSISRYFIYWVKEAL